MTGPIWDKTGCAQSTLDARAQRFMAGHDVVLDREIFTYDIQATAAHVGGLERIGLLTAGERDDLVEGLEALRRAFESGEFIVDARFEDGHSAIEIYLTERLGELGKRVHAGRSRNDQVLVATRLWLRDALDRLFELDCQSATVFLDRAVADAMLPMPGYTHLQRAVPSSVGLWLGGFAEAFIDNATMARHTREWIDACPLGTAAGYGVNLPLDREGVARELGFSRLQLNPVYAQNSRGKLELAALSALDQALLDLRRFAWDLSLFTTSELAFVELPDAYTTGSSIMPNKRNPDLVELLRASPGVVEGAMVEIRALLALPSGYHRDLQNTKAPLIRAVTHGLDALALLPDLVAGLSFDGERMRACIDGPMHATDRAVELTRDGVPFREAYRQVAQELDTLGNRVPEQSLADRCSPGAPGNLRLDVLQARLDGLRRAPA